MLRREQGAAGQRVTFVELFFDLVYVLAVTQLSHLLLEHLDARGSAQTALPQCRGRQRGDRAEPLPGLQLTGTEDGC